MEFDLKTINSGDLMFTSNTGRGPIELFKFFTMSDVMHCGIAAWFKAEPDEYIDLTTENIEERLKFNYEEGTRLYIFDMGTKVRIIPYEKLKKLSGKCIHRGLVFDNKEIHFKRFQKFFKRHKDMENECLNFSESIKVWMTSFGYNHDYVFNSESCVSFVLLWLISCGYHHTQNVPKRPRQFFNPDHLRTKYSKTDILSDVETVIYSERKDLPDFVFWIVTVLFIFLFLTIIFVVRNIFILLIYFTGIIFLFQKLQILYLEYIGRRSGVQ